MIRTASLLVAAAAATASADIRITEWMYDGAAEFVEFTNVGATPIDMTGWVYDDVSRISSPADATGSAGFGLDLSPFGIVQPGESVIIHETDDFIFRTDWSLPASVKTIPLYENNLGRGDEINLFNASGDLIDRLAYADNGAAGGPRTQGFSGNPMSVAALGANNANLWTLSAVGDFYGSYASVAGDVANPGIFRIPSPSAAALLGLGGLVATRRRR